MPLRIRVPATSANIGPGFDTLGCALSLYNYFEFSFADTTVIEGCPPEYAGEDNLALVAFRAAEKCAGRNPCGVKIKIETNVPVARGLGSSAALLVGGAVGANLLLGLGLSQNELLATVTTLEGHPDNVAPALLGGFTATMMQDGLPVAVNFPVHAGLRFCALVPDFETSTKEARAVLPTTVARADAVFTSSHVALLLSALATGDTALLGAALHDRLHEPYRRALIHEFDAVSSAAHACGAHAFFISGSGSTCMAIYTDVGFPDAMRRQLAPLSHAWQILPLDLDRSGACAVE